MRLLITAVFLLLWFTRASVGADDRPPNFVLIFIDDMGYADVGCFGATGYETPHIDAMATRGMRFTDFYVTEPVCSASRASILTGCYAKRLSIRGALGPRATHGLHHDEWTIAEVLKQRNYATAAYGKWHLGHHTEFLPTHHGFDEYFGLPYSNDMWPVHYDGSPIDPDNPAHRKVKDDYPQLPLISGDQIVGQVRTLADQATLTTRITQHATQFIDAHHDQPFFLYVAHPMVHVPLGVSEKFKDTTEQGMYGDTVAEIDWSVGQILASLESHGITNDTLVVFTSDNGPWLNYGNHAGDVGPLREAKGATWDGGVRVPCIMQWPGHIDAGIATHELTSTLDILPTFAALADAPLPDRVIDGLNIAPLLLGETEHSPRDHIVFYYSNLLECIRVGQWKLHLPHGYRSYEGVEPGMDGFPGPYARGRTGTELYDLSTDIGERHDVAAEHPDVIERIMPLVERYRRELGNGEQQGTRVRPPARISDNAGANEPVAMLGATVYVNPTAPPIQDGIVLIRGATIEAVGSRDTVQVPSNALLLDCTGCTITAGLWNSHVHFFERKWADAADIPAVDVARQLTDMFSRYGFTSVFDLSSQWENTRSLRDRIESGEVLGPRIFSTGPGLVPPGALPPSLVLDMMGVMQTPMPEVANARQAIDESRSLLDAGVDGIKLFLSSQHGVALAPSIIQAAAREAHQRGRPTFAHPNTAADVLAAINGGVDIIAHTTPGSGPWTEELVAAVVGRDIALTPTLTLWKQSKRHDRISEQEQLVNTAVGQLRAWIAGGGEVLFGSDLGAVGYDPSDEYELMARAGMSFADILTALTTAPARRFDDASRFGQIAPGFQADIVVVDGDPATDIRSLANVRLTLRSGNVVYQAND